ncbi:MAG: DinB family protein [Planctomycetota bacterium]|jgi:hypothetical protein
MRLRFEVALDVLRRTPVVLRAMLEGLDEDVLRANYGDDTFSPIDVVGHLILGERTDWIARARIILEEGETRPFDPFDRFAFRDEIPGRRCEELLAEFETLRTANLERVEEMGLAAEDLARRGTHPELGTVTLGELFATWAVHDLNHVAQIAKAISFQYRDAVGPWRAYLPVIPE